MLSASAWSSLLVLTMQLADASLPDCTWDTCPLCLVNSSVVTAPLSFLALDGATYQIPLRIASASSFWDSLSIESRILGILAAEKLGIEIKYVDVNDEVQTMLAIMNCPGWRAYNEYRCANAPISAEDSLKMTQAGDKMFADPLPDILVSVEQLPTPTIIPSALPFDLGATGFSAYYSMFVPPEVVEEAWQQKELVLDTYKVFTTDKFLPFLATPSAIISAGVQPILQGCPDEWTPEFRVGNAQAVYALRILQTKYKYVCRDSWWLSPACAALGSEWKTKCAAFIEDIWYPMKQGMHSVISSRGLRIACTTVGSEIWSQLVTNRTLNFTFSWWFPDSTFIGSQPQRVFLPEVYTSGTFLTSKVIWKPLKDWSHSLSMMLAELVFSSQVIEDLMMTLATALNQGHSISANFYQKIACDWLRNNSDAWKSMVPNAENCGKGEIFLANNGLCTPCKPGTFWHQSVKGSLCALCPAGKTQPDAGMTTCIPCAAGTFSNATGMRLDPANCPRCQVGAYSATTGSTMCVQCQLYQNTEGEGSRSPSSCKCQAGYHDTSNFTALVGLGACVPCSGEMLCTFGQVIPNLKAGYFSTADEPLSFFQCLPDVTSSSACLSGPVGAIPCSSLRQGFLCSQCPGGYARSGTECKACTGTVIFLVILAGLLCLLLIAVIVVAANQSQANEHPGTRSSSILAGQMLTFLQVLLSISETGVEWGHPLSDILGALRILSLDFDFLRVECIGMTDPVLKFLLRVIFPSASFLAVAFVLVLVDRILKLEFVSSNGLFNGLGRLMVVSYISVTLVSFGPFHCYSHPNGKLSMMDNVEVLCWESSLHSSILGISCVAITIYVAGTFTVVAYAIWKYPSEIIRHDLSFITRFHFLFSRFSPRCYWFSGLFLVRNLFLSIFPMVFKREYRDMTLLVMSLAIEIVCLLEVWSMPWTSHLLNATNIFLTQILFFCSAVSLTLSHEGTHLSLPLSVFVSVVGILAVLAILLAIFNRILERIKTFKYDMFLSHHKGAAACCARFLKTALTARSKSLKVFYDCDDLMQLSNLLDAVKESRCVLVIMSGQTLCRPWCAGEIVTAYKNDIPLYPCTIFANEDDVLDDYQKMTPHQVERLYREFFVLKPYSMGKEDFDKSFQHLLTSPILHFAISTDSTLEDELEETIQVTKKAIVRTSLLVVATPTVTTIQHSRTCSATKAASWLVMAAPSDTESAAAARTLKILLQKMCQTSVLLDLGINGESLSKLILHGNLIVVIYLLNDKSFSDAAHLARLAVVKKTDPSLQVLPVIIGMSINYPTAKFYRDLARDGGSFGSSADELFQQHANADINKVVVSRILKALLRNITHTVDLTTASEPVILLNVKRLADRVTSLPKFQEQDVNSVESLGMTMTYTRTESAGAAVRLEQSEIEVDQVLTYPVPGAISKAEEAAIPIPGTIAKAEDVS